MSLRLAPLFTALLFALGGPACTPGSAGTGDTCGLLDGGSADGGAGDGGADGGTADGGSADGGSGDGGDGGGDGGKEVGDTVIYTIRHAEKESEGTDPVLTEEGEARAEALAVLMHDVPLSAIYATTYQRTQLTVAPTAADHGLTPVTDIDPERELAEHILSADAGLTVLHCGHSFTLTDFMRALGMDDPPDIDSEVYGEMWIITVTADGDLSYELSHFGD